MYLEQGLAAREMLRRGKLIEESIENSRRAFPEEIVELADAPPKPRLGTTVRPGVTNNIKGSVFENVSESAARRAGQFPFFRAQRRGGMDLALLDDGTVILRETKFANRLQYDDFTAITTNLRTNIAEIRAELATAEGLTRAEKELITRTLDDALAGRPPANLKIQVQTGKASVGPRLQTRLQRNTEGIPVEFVALP
jgi:hypothetical protein